MNAEMVSVPLDDLKRTINVLRYAAHPHPSPHADYWENFLAKPTAQHQGEPVACDADVYSNGKSVCLVDIPKETAEIICRSISAVAGLRVDWHYFGGRVHIKSLANPPEQPAPVLPERMKYHSHVDTSSHKDGWNACLDAIAKLKGAKP